MFIKWKVKIYLVDEYHREKKIRKFLIIANIHLYVHPRYIYIP